MGRRGVMNITPETVHSPPRIFPPAEKGRIESFQVQNGQLHPDIVTLIRFLNGSVDGTKKKKHVSYVF